MSKQKNQTGKKTLLINPMNQSSAIADVTLRDLPFFERMQTLLVPSVLIPFGAGLSASQFEFSLSSQSVMEISQNRFATSNNNIEHTVQVQLRLCLNNSTLIQDDYYPTEFGIKVNGKEVQLPKPLAVRPGQPIKRFPEPLNITNLVQVTTNKSNKIEIIWKPEENKTFAFTIHLVRKLGTEILMKRLRAKGIKPYDFTRGVIKEKLDEDGESEIKTVHLRVSLSCPLGKSRMTTPCRASTCNHLQCFDAIAFLQMNEQKSTWKCPVCDKPALYPDLFIDGYFHDVINSPKLAPHESEIILHKDGSWTNLSAKDEMMRKETETNNDENILEILSSDEEDVKPAVKKEKPIVKKEKEKAKKDEAVPELRKRQASRTSARINASKRLKKSKSEDLSMATDVSNIVAAPDLAPFFTSRPAQSMESIDLTQDDD